MLPLSHPSSRCSGARLAARLAFFVVLLAAPGGLRAQTPVAYVADDVEVNAFGSVQAVEAMLERAWKIRAAPEPERAEGIRRIEQLFRAHDREAQLEEARTEGRKAWRGRA